MSQSNMLVGEDELTFVDLAAESKLLRPPSPDALSWHSQDSCHLAVASQESAGAEEKGELDVKVVTKDKVNKKQKKDFTVMAEMPTYKMDVKPRGLALIVEIEKYVNDVQERRIGSHHDVNNLKRLFEALFFVVEVHCNPEKRQFDQLLECFAADPRHECGDMMILAILSHGRDGQVYTADGRHNPIERVYERFNNLNCPTLKGKPKFFIVQACRGDETDTGMEEESAIPSRKRHRSGTDRDTIPFGILGEMNKARPTWEDMVIAYSTIPGFASIRDHERGTWFIQSLVEVFMNHAYERELIDLLRMTSEYLSQFTNENKEKQTCNIELRHLYKRIYFNPGIPRSPRSLRRCKSTPPSSPRRE